MPKNIRHIEVYVGYVDHSWETRMIPILASTPETAIESVTIEVATHLLSHQNDIAFIGVYHIPEDYDDY